VESIWVFVVGVHRTVSRRIRSHEVFVFLNGGKKRGRSALGTVTGSEEVSRKYRVDTCDACGSFWKATVKGKL
jgi:hypothetical protein